MNRSSFGRWSTGILSLAVAAVAFGAAPAQAQDSRHTVVVPRLQPRGDFSKKFGEKTAEELRDAIENEKYRALDKKELEQSLKKYEMKEDEFNCIDAKQFQIAEQLNLTFCGTYIELGKDLYEVQGEFCANMTTCFSVPAVQARNERDAAQQLVAAFAEYTRQIEYLAYCSDSQQSEQWEEALRQCNEALAINPTYMPALLLKGDVLRNLDRNEEALAAFEQVLAQNELHEDALYAAGYIAAVLGQQEKSRGYYNLYLELNPGNADLRLVLAHQLAQAGDNASALVMAEQGMQELPADSVHLPLIEFSGHFAKNAANDLRGEAEEAPAEAVELYRKALGYYRQVYEVQGAEASADLLKNVMLMYRETGELDQALSFGEQALATHGSDAGLWWVHARSLEMAERMDEALEALKRVVELDPQYPSAHAKLFTLHVAAGNRAEAVAAAEQAVEQGFESDRAAQIIGVNGGWSKFGQHGRNDEALRWYEAARPLATEQRTRHMMNFFEGYAHLQRGRAAHTPETCASARATLPIFRRALELLQNSTAYDQPDRAGLIDNAKTYVEIEGLLIDSKCR
ncbi:MAG: tetratricopeptide repeat protein [Gemmatimonadota bacterium]